MTVKNRWKGMFNFNRELYIKYAFAYSKDQAKIIMARRIAKEQEVLPVVVLGYLKEHPNSWEIILETEFKEVV
jgi:hypothetical protein